MGSIIFSFRNFRKAFTLIELMIVISIIGVLTVALIPQMSQYMNRSRDAERLSNMSNIQLALEQYKVENKIYPIHSGGCAPTNTLITGKYLTKPSSSPSGVTYNEGCGNNGEFGYGRKGGNGYILMAIMENTQGGNYSGSTDGFTGDVTASGIAKTANIVKGAGRVYLRATNSIIVSATTMTIDPPEAGVCGITANTCNLGTPSGYSAGACGGSQTWYCDGLNGGATSPQCTYANAVCSDCTLSGTTIVHGGSTPAYTTPSVTSPATCGAPITRYCTDGTLDGSATYAYPSCVQGDIVTFNGNGGSGHSPTVKNVAHSAVLGTLPGTPPNRTGYNFNGWFTATTGGTAVTASTPINGNVTFYAQWTVIVNGICGSASGTTISTYPTSNLCNSGTIVDVDTVGSDGIFNWSCNGSGGGTNMNCSATKILCTPVEALINGYYVIDPTQPNCSLGCNVAGLTDPVNKCILKLGTTYIAPGITDVAKINTPCGGSASPCSPAILSNSTNVKGYCTNATWGGKTWFFPTYPTNTKNNLSLLLNTQANYWTRHCEDCDQYAGIKWRINSSGGSPTANTASYAVRCESSSAAAVNGSCGTSDGGTFASTPSVNLCTSGASSSVSGTGPWLWSCGGLNGGTTEACNADLGYTVTFNGNGGTGHAPTMKLVASGAALGTLPSNPAQAGYSFSGWYTAMTGGTTVTTATVISTGATYYAQWISLPAFTTTWKVGTAGYGNADNTVTFNVAFSGANYSINWGDGTIQTLTTATPSHTYATAGDKTVKIQGGLQRFYNPGLTNNYFGKLTAVTDWGNMSWTSMNGMFTYADHLNTIPAAAPNMVNVTDMGNMFWGATLFNQPLNSWNTSSVTNMNSLFYLASAFNQPLNTWNTSSVTDMSFMFQGASTFNQPLSTWNTSNVTSMQNMFQGASTFNQNISAWNVSNVTMMYLMFMDATAFNQPLNTWDVSKVTDMGAMFMGATLFNQPLNAWNTSSVLNMSQMFEYATTFNQNISTWNTANVTSMQAMFMGATIYNQPLNTWNVGNVTNTANMFRGAPAFNQPLNTWNVSKVWTMDSMFQGASSFNQDIHTWCVPLIAAKPSNFDTSSNAGFLNQTAKQPQWGGCSYTVTFNGNGGAGHTPTTKTISPSTAVGTLPSNPTRTGYTFNGWYTTTTGGTAVTAATIISSDVTFYAQWSVIAGYPGCDTPDIILGNGQKWAACDVGSTVAGTTSASYGSFFQWGRNVPFPSSGTVTTIAGPLSLATANATSNFITNSTSPFDWLTPQDNNRWGGVSTNDTTGTYQTVSPADQAKMQGPCAADYHVPTTKEWCDTITTINGSITCTSAWQNDITIRNTLKIPFAGYRVFMTSIISFQGSKGVYGSATPTSLIGRNVVFNSTQIYPLDDANHADGLSVRCLKNPPINGSCGTANGVATASYPTANWCTTGTKADVDTVGSDGVFNWSCNGSGGGTNVSCSASKSVVGGILVRLGASAFNVYMPVYSTSVHDMLGWSTYSQHLVPGQVCVTTISSWIKPYVWNYPSSEWGVPNTSGPTRTFGLISGHANGSGSCVGDAAITYGLYAWSAAAGGGTQPNAPLDIQPRTCYLYNGHSTSSIHSPSTMSDYLIDTLYQTGTLVWNPTKYGSAEQYYDCILPINGSCGSANGVATALYPTANWCTTGTKADVDTVGSDGVFNWSCNGSGGGSSVSCGANKLASYHWVWFWYDAGSGCSAAYADCPSGNPASMSCSNLSETCRVETPLGSCNYDIYRCQ